MCLGMPVKQMTSIQRASGSAEHIWCYLTWHEGEFVSRCAIIVRNIEIETPIFADWDILAQARTAYMDRQTQDPCALPVLV